MVDEADIERKLVYADVAAKMIRAAASARIDNRKGLSDLNGS